MFAKYFSKRVSSLFAIALWSAAAVAVVPGGRVCAQSTTPESTGLRASDSYKGKTLSEWTAELKDRDLSVREQAVAAIKVYGSAARSAAPLIIRLMDDSDISLRVNAVITCGYIGLDQRDLGQAVTVLSRLLGHPQGIIRYQAARTLGQLGPSAVTALGPLLQNLRDPSTWEIRSAAAFAIGNVAYNEQQGADSRVMHSLLEALQTDRSVAVRLEVLYSLIQLGRPAQNIDRLNELQILQGIVNGKQQRETVPIWARVAIMRVDDAGVSEGHLLAIAKSLKSPDMQARVHAARALATIGYGAKSRVADLADALNDKEPEVTVWACAALSTMREAAKPAASKLKELKQHTNDAVRRAAEQALVALNIP